MLHAQHVKCSGCSVKVIAVGIAPERIVAIAAAVRLRPAFIHVTVPCPTQYVAAPSTSAMAIYSRRTEVARHAAAAAARARWYYTRYRAATAGRMTSAFRSIRALELLEYGTRSSTQFACTRAQGDRIAGSMKIQVVTASRFWHTLGDTCMAIEVQDLII